MFGSYYKTAVRQIARNRFHAVLNIIGLSVGMAFTLLIAVYVWSEYTVNHDLRNAGRQYILTSEFKDPNLGFALATLGPLAKELKTNYPALIANYYRFDGLTAIVSTNNHQFREELQIGDSTFLPMFGFRLIHGDAANALNKPFTTVITADRAIKFFGTTDVVGKELTITNNSGRRANFRITGVLQTPARNSVTQLTTNNTIFIPDVNLEWFGRNMDWDNAFIANYIELRPGASVGAVDHALVHLIQTNANPVFAANLTVQPELLSDYYLDANGAAVRKTVYVLGLVAVFILGMAMINFINLSVSRSDKRMREIGIRTLLGSTRRRLRQQFLTESVVLSLISTIVAVGLYAALCPAFSEMLNRPLPSLPDLPLPAWTLIAVFGMGTGWLAGVYPAFLLTSAPTIQVLKGQTGSIGRHVLLRKGLVGFQFVTALIVYSAVMIVNRQIHLFFSDRLGYNKDFVLTAQLPRDWTPDGVRRMLHIRSEFAAMPQVRQAALSFEIPNGAFGDYIRIYHNGADSAHALNAQSLEADAHYAATYQIPLAAGVFFQDPGSNPASDSRPPDSTKIVLNETAARALGYSQPDDAVGQRVRLVGTNDPFTISGVVRDFHFDGMGAAIQPEVFTTVNTWNSYRYLSLKLGPGNLPATIAALQHQWVRLMPGVPFEYRFMDEVLRSIYDGELRLKKAAFTATILAFFIVVLGVFGLVSASVRKRTREIAIRKVIGAGVAGIVRLFLKEYLLLLAAAGLVAIPFTTWIMQQWLNDYPTRISMTPVPYIVALASTGLLVAALVILQTLSAARTNPAHSLRAD